MSDDRNARKPRIIAFSEAMGPIPCQVVGRNRTHYLVHAYGATIPVPKELVFELTDGWELRSGQILPIEGSDAAGEEAPALLQFEMETAPTTV